MPIIFNSLSVWDIAHRWAGYDPDNFRVRLPLFVRDYVRLLMDAVLNGEIFCETLTLAKRPLDSKADPKFYIRTHLDDVNACIHGARYSRKLLKWASISRYDFQEWCERLSIPLPEFWFPEGWNDSFEMPEGGTRAFWARHVEPDEPGGFSLRFDIPEEHFDVELQASNPSDENQSLRPNQLAKIRAQQYAIQR